MTQLMQRLMVGLMVAGLSMSALAQDIWTGGVGIDERQLAPERNTRIQFFVTGGPYLADVHYVLYDEQGTRMHEGTADGPWVLVDLPAGTYSVKATRGATGETQSTRFFRQGGGKMVIGLQFNRVSSD